MLQLADLARRHETLDPSRLSGQPPAFLSAPLLAGDRPALLAHAAELAVRRGEFASSVLGGQQRDGEQGVFVLNDGHRRIEQTIVLKRLVVDEAAREWEWDDWAAPEALHGTYPAALDEFGLTVPRAADVLADSLEALTVFHAVKGIGRIRRWSDDVSSFTLSLRGAQEEHYWSILDHLATHGRDGTAQALCRLFLTEVRRERTTTG